mgnify:CR=1 FL=1
MWFATLGQDTLGQDKRVKMRRLSPVFKILLFCVLVFICSAAKEGEVVRGLRSGDVFVSNISYAVRRNASSNVEINRLVELAKNANVLCNKPNSRLQGDYLITDNNWKEFPASARQKVSECNVPMLKIIAVRYLKFVDKICPTDKRNGQPSATHGQINVTIETTEPVGLGKLTKVTQKARVLQRHAGEPLKMMQDLHRPGELQHVAAFLLEQATTAQDYIEEMGSMIKPFYVKPKDEREADAQLALEERKMQIHERMVKKESSPPSSG